MTLNKIYWAHIEGIGVSRWRATKPMPIWDSKELAWDMVLIDKFNGLSAYKAVIKIVGFTDFEKYGFSRVNKRRKIKQYYVRNDDTTDQNGRERKSC